MIVRVVTLPAGVKPNAVSAAARPLGADALEVRDDLTSQLDDGEETALPLLLAFRHGGRFSERAIETARWVDVPLGSVPPQGLDSHRRICSWHADRALTPDEAEALWRSAPPGSIKHVEPLGEPRSGARLLETQRRLMARFGAGSVTVLATGECALPWRAVLAQRNAFDYLALPGLSPAALGQRLLPDAVRADREPFQGRPSPGRWALIGSGIAQARSPRLHAPPFDRWDLPPDASVRELVEALTPHYRGFALTAPFKQRWEPGRAVNTLVRHADGWRAFNTDVEGAQQVLRRYRLNHFTVLGDGGATWALRAAAPNRLAVLRAREARPLSGDVVWTWPEPLPTPPGLRLEGARVFLLCYGAAAVRLAARVRELGGTPVLAGRTWLIAQARAQRRLFLEATP